MRGLVFSDLHVHPYKAFSKVDELGMNSRLSQILDVVAFLVNRSLQPDIDFVAVPGDVFHSKDRVYVRAYTEAIALLKTIEVPTLFVTGNHDFVSKKDGEASFSAVQLMKEMGSQFYLDEPMEVKGLTIYGLPYMEDVERHCRVIEGIPREAAIVTHAEVWGAIDRNYQFPNGLPVHLLDEFRFSIVGHIHTPQLLSSRVLLPGSPLHHDFGDAGRLAYAWLVDIENGPVKFTPFEIPGPRFYSFTREQFEGVPPPAPDQYVRVIGEATGEIENVVFVPNLDQASILEGRGGVSLTSSKRELLEKWLRFKGIENEFADYLAYGEKLL